MPSPARRPRALVRPKALHNPIVLGSARPTPVDQIAVLAPPMGSLAISVSPVTPSVTISVWSRVAPAHEPITTFMYVL